MENFSVTPDQVIRVGGLLVGLYILVHVNRLTLKSIREEGKTSKDKITELSACFESYRTIIGNLKEKIILLENDLEHIEEAIEQYRMDINPQKIAMMENNINHICSALDKINQEIKEIRK